MTKTALVILGAILTATAGPAVASGQEGPVQVVSYSDLDLASETGRVRFDRRIVAAVRRVCGRAWPLDLGAVGAVRRCRSDTFAEIAADRRVGEVFVAQLALR